MKKLIVLFFILPVLCFGQKDYCKKIKKSADDGKGIITYKSPVLTNISVIKQVKANPFFGLMLHFNGRMPHLEAKGATIEFEDGTILKDENAKVYCQQQGVLIEASNANNSTINSGEYVLQGFFHIGDETLEKFTTQKIVRIELANASQKVSGKEATSVLNYISCMKDMSTSE